MESAMMIARVFGPFMAILGLWVLLYSDNVAKIWNSMKNSPAALYASAVLNLLVGLFIINGYNFWSMNIFFFVTLLGWVSFIRGVIGLFMPQLIVRLFMLKSSGIRLLGLVPLVWGLILIWAGFYS